MFTAPPSVPATPSPVVATHVIVSYSEMSTSPLPLWTAVDNRPFAKHGIDIESQYIPNTNGVAGLLSGSTSVAFMGGSDILGAVTDGTDLVIVACAVAVFADSVQLLSQSNDKLVGFDPNTIIDNSFVQSAQDRGLTQP